MIKNYWNMYRKYGFKLVYAYFVYSHYFDLKNHVDTHLWVPKDDLYNEQNVYYLGSWTKTIKQTYELVDQMLGDTINTYSFIDAGCGKGRVLLMWEQLSKAHNRNITLTGVDLNSKLVDIARKNYQIMFKKEGNFLIDNICNLALDQFGDNIIIYMFNPFGADILKAMLCHIQDKNVIIIYVFPVHFEVLLQFGYKEIYNQDGWHPIMRIKIFTNH